jgi:hypothetical protein
MRWVIIGAIVTAMLWPAIAKGNSSSPTASADKRYQFSARFDYLVIGIRQAPPCDPRPAQRRCATWEDLLTGGLKPTAEFSFLLPIAAVDLRVGAEFGFTVDNPRWMALMGGLFVSAGGRPVAPVPIVVNASLHLDAGRVPVLNSWGLPLNYSGIYPGAALTAAYQPAPLWQIGLRAGAWWVDSYSWSGPPLDEGIWMRLEW